MSTLFFRLRRLVRSTWPSGTAYMVLLMATMALGCSSPRHAPLQVAAASSLRSFMGIAATMFEAETGTPVEIRFGGSHILAQQISSGAPADVFYAANIEYAAIVADAAGKSSRAFADSRLVIITRSQKAVLQTWQDLPAAGSIVLGGPSVPIGRYSHDFLVAATDEVDGFASAVGRHVVSYQSNARDVLAQVSLGSAEAAIVYASDIGGGDTPTNGIRTIEIPERLQPEIEIFEVTLEPTKDSAKRWNAYMKGPKIRAVAQGMGLTPHG